MIKKLLSNLLLASAIVVGLSVAPPPGAYADDDDDDASEHDAARQALVLGLIRPLEEIIVIARKHVEGDLIEIELERENGRYIYELEFIQPSGQVIEIKIDAKTMAIIEEDDD